MNPRAAAALSACLLFSPFLGAAPTPAGRAFERPGWTTWLQRQIGDQKAFWRRAASRKDRTTLGLVAVSTLWLTARDQYLYEKGRRRGDGWGISHDGEQRTFFKTRLWPTDYIVRLNGPHDAGTALYFLGDGLTHFSIAGGFLAVGAMRGDNRALQTASQMVEGIVANGVVVQVLKHATGRENPNTGTAKNGKWRLFPNQKDYAKHVNKYDAFPSGHLSTAMVTVTVIAENYPEKRWVRPLGYALMSGLAFQMVNNGVHWVSDYPLALYLGHRFGMIAAGHGAAPGVLEVGPAWVDDAPGLRAAWRFGGDVGGAAAHARHRRSVGARGT